MYRVNHTFYFILVLCAMAWMHPVRMYAQAKNVTVTVYRIENPQKPKEKIPWNRQIVYGFFSAAKANRFYENCEAEKRKGMTYVPLREDEYDVQAETDEDGICSVLLPLTGYIIVKPDGADTKKEAIKGRLEIDLNIVAAKSLKNVVVIEKRPPGPEPQIPNSCGNRLNFEYMFPLSAEQVDVKSRIIIKPVVTVLETGDTLGFLEPFVKDGVEFIKPNERRLGFDIKRDPLYEYRDSIIGIMYHSHQKDSIPISFELYPIERKLHYRVTADMVYGMNQKTPYRVDSICLAEGYVRDPMRFLDYDMIEKPMERSRYARTRRAQLSKDQERMNLTFLVGEAKLDPSDTTNVAQLEKLKRNLSRYMGADAGITGAIIHGSASPEGGIVTNERLCKERAEYLRKELYAFPALENARRSGEIKTTAKVASWERVADELVADSLVAEAELVRTVLQMTHDSRRQEEHIRKLPCWEVIEKRILPKLRYVDIEYFYYIHRPKKKEEIWKQYKEDPDYHAGRKQLPYEFYELLGLIKDPVEKEPIAKAAYEAVKDEGGVRQWPLAAYDLAQCYLARDYVDTILLKPYLDTSIRKLYHKSNFENDSWEGWYNDPAIVTTHINMLCKAGDFAAAYRCAYLLLPDSEPQNKKLHMFLRCMNCEWDDLEVMDTVSNSSYWNKIVILAAQQDVSNKENALFMLGDVAKVNQADPKVLYMKAQLLFNLYGKYQKSTVGYRDENFMIDSFFEPSSSDPYTDDFGEALINWGLPMAQCCTIDESFVDIMLFDGEFNEDYRKAFKAYWKKVKDGILPRPVLPEPTAQSGGGAVPVQEDEDLLDEAFGIED